MRSLCNILVQISSNSGFDSSSWMTTSWSWYGGGNNKINQSAHVVWLILGCIGSVCYIYKNLSLNLEKENTGNVMCEQCLHYGKKVHLFRDIKDSQIATTFWVSHQTRWSPQESQYRPCPGSWRCTPCRTPWCSRPVQGVHMKWFTFSNLTSSNRASAFGFGLFMCTNTHIADTQFIFHLNSDKPLMLYSFDVHINAKPEIFLELFYEVI